MTNAVIDLSHHNTVFSFHEAAANGIVGVIHKASQGTGFTDPKFAESRARCNVVGLSWGAYHFGTGEDPVAQADFFLQTAQPNQDTLLVLDFEHNPAGGSMNVAQAEAFVQHIHEQTGTWPGFYSGNFIKDLLGSDTSDVLANCWLWLAEYGPTPRIQATWGDWTLWQYTDGAVGPQPHTVTGVGHCDRDQFNGDLAALKDFWNTNEV